MPSINDIVQVAEALESCPVTVVADRCVAVRNRNASCRRCVNACASDAITVRANEVAISASACIGCGACIPACPTEALVMLNPPRQAVLAKAAAPLAKGVRRVVIACARIASKRQADPECFAEVPCLAYVDESLVIELAAKGAASLLLVDGNCHTCKHEPFTAAVGSALASARELLAAHGCTPDIRRVTGFPEELRAQVAEGGYGSSRRGFLAGAASAAKKTVRDAAVMTIENELGYSPFEKPIGERLRVDDRGRMPQLTMPRHERVLNALDAIGGPAEKAVETRLFGSVQVDAAKCNACGMCATFCPTGAISRDYRAGEAAPLSTYEFSAADCVQCGLCADVCWKGALVLSGTVRLSEVYDFEPRTFV